MEAAHRRAHPWRGRAHPRPCLRHRHLDPRHRTALSHEPRRRRGVARGIPRDRPRQAARARQRRARAHARRGLPRGAALRLHLVFLSSEVRRPAAARAQLPLDAEGGRTAADARLHFSAEALSSSALAHVLPAAQGDRRGVLPGVARNLSRPAGPHREDALGAGARARARREWLFRHPHRLSHRVRLGHRQRAPHKLSGRLGEQARRFVVGK